MYRDRIQVRYGVITNEEINNTISISNSIQSLYKKLPNINCVNYKDLPNDKYVNRKD